MKRNPRIKGGGGGGRGNPVTRFNGFFEKIVLITRFVLIDDFENSDFSSSTKLR